MSQSSSHALRIQQCCKSQTVTIFCYNISLMGYIQCHGKKYFKGILHHETRTRHSQWHEKRVWLPPALSNVKSWRLSHSELGPIFIRWSYTEAHQPKEKCQKISVDGIFYGCTSYCPLYREEHIPHQRLTKYKNDASHLRIEFCSKGHHLAFVMKSGQGSWGWRVRGWRKNSFSEIHDKKRSWGI